MSDAWVRATMASVVTQVRRRVQVEAGRDYRLLGVRWYGAGPFHREVVTSKTSKATHLFRAEEGDFIYNRLFAWKGSFGVVGPELAGSYVSGEFPLFQVDGDRLLLSYLNLFMQRADVWAQIEVESTGSTPTSRNRWKEAQFLASDIDLPSLDEQRRIVDLIDAVDAALNASLVLERSCSALGTRLRAELMGGALAMARSEMLGEVATSRLGKMLSGASKTGVGEYPYVRNVDVQWDAINLEDLNTMVFAERERTEFGLRPGDVLVCEGGEVGRAAVVDDELPGIFFQKAIHRVRCGPSLSPRFLMHYLRFCAETGGFDNYATQLTIQHLTGEKLRTLPVPIPDLPEQQSVVESLDTITALGRAARGQAEALKQLRGSMLDELFSGEHEIPSSYDSLLELV